MQHKKYSRSLHAQISLGTTSDDRFMPNGYVASFAAKPLILTEKLDGQNNCLSRYGVFARSHAAPSSHPWDKPLLERWQLIKDDLQDLELFGENLYGIHSVAYSRLQSFFYLFAVREKGHWLSWEEVAFYAALFDFPTVPVLPIRRPLADFVQEGSRKTGLCRYGWRTAWVCLGRGMWKRPGSWAVTTRNRARLVARGWLSAMRRTLRRITAICPSKPMSLTICSSWCVPGM
ncbi:MAG: RNA ligase family protein [Neisseria sp.]|nr:RNA ligase family protein [Neisseria sp.]